MSKDLYQCNFENCPAVKSSKKKIRQHLAQYHGLDKHEINYYMDKWDYLDPEDLEKRTSIPIWELRKYSRKAHGDPE